MKIFVWNSRSLLIGNIEELSFHSDRSCYLLSSLNSKNFEIRKENTSWESFHSVLIPKGLNIDLQGKDSLIAALSTDPKDLENWLGSPSSGSFLNIGELGEKFQSISNKLYQCSENPEEQKSYLYELDSLLPPKFVPNATDPRIYSVTKKISENLLENLSSSELAGLAGLSVSRLEHLFKELVGISITEFRNWQRLKNATLAISQGENLTDAAHAAGFYDSAHYANSFKKAYGFFPSVFLNSQTKLYLF
ncbi:helix-turn-helix domain-containing protein [Leptospira sarikeiensis]|uniref:AraC family transcriptional regulator n=1 Tax=Leptospira sarikeiensis TaxID=2484943 RepID=A0A4R9KF62_9LEPT|nr:AraC family transcriptional regulator [Leptospira sarikeiensis]TGL65711.1 AraC family transcriptional regulator [Leptospira sarikeiensis]